jgi:hypothetical protein
MPYDSSDEVEHICEDKAYYLDNPDVPTNVRIIPAAYQIEEARQWLLNNSEILKRERIFLNDNELTPSIYVSSTDPVPYEDYELTTGFPLDDFESPEATDITRDDEWQGIFDNRDNYQKVQYFNYSDTEPKRCTTSGRHWWVGYNNGERQYTNCGRLPEGFMPKDFTTEESHNSFREVLDHNDPAMVRYEFETLQGMITENLIDLTVTENYQYRFFNVYFGRDSKLHLGLLTFDTSPDGRPTVSCKANGCYYKRNPHTYPGSLDSRDDMEAFITACIRHGNHHGPNWIRNRADYTHMHATDCDAVHWLSTDPNSPCNCNDPKFQFSTESLDDTIDFLIRHRKFCRNTECRCTHYYHLLNERTYAA